MQGPWWLGWLWAAHWINTHEMWHTSEFRCWDQSLLSSGIVMLSWGCGSGRDDDQLRHGLVSSWRTQGKATKGEVRSPRIICNVLGMFANNIEKQYWHLKIRFRAKSQVKGTVCWQKFWAARATGQHGVFYIVFEREVQMPPINILIMGELCLTWKICLCFVIYGGILWKKAQTSRES